MTVLDRFIRLHDAPGYLGMDRSIFESEVRPHMIEIPIGARGIAYDRLDLDAFADEYKRRNGRPSRNAKGNSACRQGQKALAPAATAKRVSTSNIKEGASSSDSAQLARTKQKRDSDKSKPGSMAKIQEALNACSAMRLHATS